MGEEERVITIMQNPRQYKIPDWFLNRQKDIKDGKFTQVLANNWESKLREDLKTEENQSPQGFETLLGSPCSWTAHKNNWKERSHCWYLRRRTKFALKMILC